MVNRPHLANIDVALFSIGNFLCYVPLYMMTKMAGQGLFPSLHGKPISSFELMPLYTAGNIIVVFTFLFLSGWIKCLESKKVLGIKLPYIRWYIFLSGLCTITQIFTAIWAYAFQGISLVFVALLMKGGVLVMAPIVDLVIKKRRRKIYWPSWIAASLALLALIISLTGKAGTTIKLICLFDIGLYLASYFLKLTIMSRFAKSKDTGERRQYIVQEQIIILLGLTLLLLITGFAGSTMPEGSVPRLVWRGFTRLPQIGFVIEPVIIGAVAGGMGIFGSLIFLDRRENTFCIAVVQSSSILAGTTAAFLLAIFYNQPAPSINKIISVIIILIAIIFLTYRGKIERSKNEEAKYHLACRPASLRKESV